LGTTVTHTVAATRGTQKALPTKPRAMNNEHPTGKNITLDNLAGMLQREFAQTRKEMQDGFYRIEKILLAKQEDRIEKLEAQMKEVRESLAI
jgi:hypothetical protein